MSELTSMVDLLRWRAAEQPDDRAYVFLSEKGTEEAELTFADLHRRAGVVAAYLAKRLRRGDRALLMFPPGLDFIVAFFGCLVAGVIAVPIMPPRRTSTRDSSEGIIADCGARIVLTSSGLVHNRIDILARLRPANPNDLRSSGLASNWANAAASSCGSAGGTSRPAPSPISSGMPPVSVAITGIP